MVHLLRFLVGCAHHTVSHLPYVIGEYIILTIVYRAVIICHMICGVHMKYHVFHIKYHVFHMKYHVFHMKYHVFT